MLPPPPPPPQLSPIDALLKANKQWANKVDKADPTFFPQCTLGQFPKVLWIGCADSRVPESVITGAKPGDIFVHRNVANQFHLDDDSALSLLSYAIDTVGIQHIIIAGHTHCGGALACYQAATATPSTLPAPPTTPLGRWLTPLTKLVSSLERDLANKSPAEALNVVVDANVRKQVTNICEAEPVRRAWEQGNKIWVHGWVYDVGTGRIRDLKVSRGPDSV